MIESLMSSAENLIHNVKLKAETLGCTFAPDPNNALGKILFILKVWRRDKENKSYSQVV